MNEDIQMVIDCIDTMLKSNKKGNEDAIENFRNLSDSDFKVIMITNYNIKKALSSLKEVLMKEYGESE